MRAGAHDCFSIARRSRDSRSQGHQSDPEGVGTELARCGEQPVIASSDMAHCVRPVGHAPGF